MAHQSANESRADVLPECLRDGSERVPRRKPSDLSAPDGKGKSWGAARSAQQQDVQREQVSEPGLTRFACASVLAGQRVCRLWFFLAQAVHL